MLEKIIEIVEDNVVHNTVTIERDSVLAGLGINSLDMVEICLEIETEFEIDITDEKAEAWKTVGDIVTCVEGLKK